MNKFIKLLDVIELTSLSKPSIYRLAEKGKFPKQIKLSERSSAWVLDEVEEWMRDRVEASRHQQGGVQ